MKTEQISNFTPPQTKRDPRGQAIIIGGSMAGLLAARVLADHFEQVTILERDVYPNGAEGRRGLPQGHHLHALLGRGQKILEEFFPGIRQEMIDSGACDLDSGEDLVWRTPHGWGKPFRSGVMVLSFSRPFLDWHIRRRLAAIDNIKFINGAEVTELESSSDLKGVGGVFFEVNGRDNDARQTSGYLAADLVIDCSGRHSRAPQWLAALGYDPPRETVVNAFLGYASRLYQRPDVVGSKPRAIFLQSAPPFQIRGGIMFPIEGNRWILTLVGGDRDYPPVDEEGFLDFVRSLPSSILFDAIRDRPALTPIRGFRATQNRLRHFEEMQRFPGQFLLLGDSVCAFNPVYGQGMTVAAMDALELSRSLSYGKKSRFNCEFTRQFQKRLARMNRLPWALATGEDCRYRGTEGASRSFKARLMQAYIDRVIALTTRDIGVRLVWLKVFQMLRPPTARFSPSTLLKVMREIIKQPKRSKPRSIAAPGQVAAASTSRDG